MTTPDTHDQPSPLISGLTVDDAIELAEMLTFIDGWLTDSDPAVAQSFHAFVGADGYALSDLRADLNRFAALLGGLEIPAHDLHSEPFREAVSSPAPAMSRRKCGLPSGRC
ncbi:hypothetical protein [Nocardia sp. SYP-A9097]|uniref:hypothetical protein n=1 Tax=Nocardia sp. SYP-A9097 TaxID=2663237 RepID=UPI001891148F|nr:hypothetical protein [Nocardia sp. SYP-A9097]